jgi:hypothetical protein
MMAVLIVVGVVFARDSFSLRGGADVEPSESVLTGAATVAPASPD